MITLSLWTKSDLRLMLFSFNSFILLIGFIQNLRIFTLWACLKQTKCLWTNKMKMRRMRPIMQHFQISYISLQIEYNPRKCHLYWKNVHLLTKISANFKISCENVNNFAKIRHVSIERIFISFIPHPFQN